MNKKENSKLHTDVRKYGMNGLYSIMPLNLKDESQNLQFRKERIRK